MAQRYAFYRAKNDQGEWLHMSATGFTTREEHSWRGTLGQMHEVEKRLGVKLTQVDVRKEELHRRDNYFKLNLDKP